MPSQGLMIAGGIGKGLQAGLDTFLKTRGLLNEEAQRQAAQAVAEKKAAMQRAAFLLRANQEGYNYDDSSGTLLETPEGKAIRAMELEKGRAQSELMRSRAKQGNLRIESQYGGGDLEPTAPPPVKMARPVLPATGPQSISRDPQSSVVGPMSPMRGPQGDVDEITQGLIDRAQYGKEMSGALLGTKHGGMSELQGDAQNDGGLIKGVMERYPVERGPIYNKNALLQYQKMLNSRTKQIGDVITNANTIKQFSIDAKTNPMKAAALPVMLARAVGEKGPLSNFDVQMWGGSKALISRLNRAAQGLVDGTLPDEDLRFVQEVAAGLGAAAEKRLSEEENEIVGQFKSNYGGSDDWAYQKVTGKPRKKAAPQGADRKPMKGLKIGQDVDGHKYLGGDPNDINSWSK